MDSAASNRLAIEERRLTEEQQAIVAHGEGPALVYAVAGAGKTTSMVHRIRRLVEEGAAPSRILASSFSRSTVRDLEEGLQRLGVGGVRCRTLHALGRSYIADAEDRGLLAPRLRQSDTNPATMARILAAKARTQLAMKRGIDTSALGIPQSDLEDQISAWKTRLVYADLQGKDLPESAEEHASQAEHDNEDFVTLYRYAERLREERGWVTFDDMLREGWEVLLRFDEIRTDARGRFDYVLIDEFQDVSLVQDRLLDILTEQHRNYMVIGDDDQCIYEWRGADPSFILDFEDRYGADTYVISDNFRSTGQQIGLANAVIQNNQRRKAKRLHLTRRFDGVTHVHRNRGRVAQAQRLVQEVEAGLREGRKMHDFVVLVRQYAQTPFIEQELIRDEIPYRIVGHQPFYLRTQVQALLRHLYFATLERRRDRQGWFDDPRVVQRYLDRFERVMLEPNRYVSSRLLRQIRRTARRDQASILDALNQRRDDMHPRTAKGIDDFLDVMEGLAERLDKPASPTVEWLIEAMGYERYIRRHSAFQETADDRIRTARSLVHFAKGLPTAASLLDEIKSIAASRVEDPSTAALELRSIHRAKGGEWPVVLVPGCNDGTIPNLTGVKSTSEGPSSSSTKTPAPQPPRTSHAEGTSHAVGTEVPTTSAGPAGDADASTPEADETPAADRAMEGERRLFYVAITRAQTALHLFLDETEPESPFLSDANVSSVLTACEDVRRVFHGAPESLDPDAMARCCVAIDRLEIDRYLQTHWQPEPDRREGIQSLLAALEAAIEEAQRSIDTYETQRSAYEEKRATQLDPLHAQLRQMDEKKYVLPSIEIPVAYSGSNPSHWVGRSVHVKAPSPPESSSPPEDPVEDSAGNNTQDLADALVFSGSVRLGTVALDRDEYGVAREALDSIPPDAIRGDVERASASGETLYVSVNVGATRRRLEARRRSAEDALTAPEPPTEMTKCLADPACARGLSILWSAIEDSTNDGSGSERLGDDDCSP